MATTKQINWRQFDALTTDRPDRVVKRLRKLAAHMRTVKLEAFDQKTWGRRADCGTVTCLAGHACDVFPERLRLVMPKPGGFQEVADIRRVANGRLVRNDDVGSGSFAEAMGLDREVASEITEPFAPHQTPTLAAKACGRLADEIERRALSARESRT